MFDDPYKVLGVTPDTPPDEIKKAYRKLAKQYHPDLHPDDPECAKKMNDINSAYDQINNPEKYKRQQSYNNPYGGSYSNSGSYQDPFSSYQRQYSYTYGNSSSSNPEFVRAEQYMQSRNYEMALSVLENVPLRERTSHWYYLSGVANANLGNKILALQQLQQAVNMEPNNLQYQVTLQRIQTGSQFYQQQSSDYCNFGGSNWCLEMCMLNLMCNCCCGGYGMRTCWF